MSDEIGRRTGARNLRDSLPVAEETVNRDAPQIYEFGPFRLEPSERKLMRGNAIVALTPKAFDTLLLLVRNSGHLMEKDELLTLLWPDSFVEEGSLSNNIFTLRKALGEDPAFIETVPRRGYRFIGAVRQLPRAGPTFPEKPSEVRTPGLASVIAKAHWPWRSRARPGFSAVGYRFPEVREADLHNPTSPVREVNPETSRGLEEIISRAIKKDREARYRDASEMLEYTLQLIRQWNRWRVAAVAAAGLAMLAIGAALWLRGPARSPDRSQWVQLTKLPDSASQPALSPDGVMLAFIRGYGTFFGPGQVYVKILPDGEPVQLTHDNLLKMSPTFSPDGSRIAYTTVDPKFNWDTWVVPTLGGEPQPLLRNASGLVWIDRQRVLFSERKMGVHMGIVASEENRIGARDVYLPADEPAMAHRSYSSPDGKSVLLVEMDQDHLWLPCRLVPMDGSTLGQHVGPLGGGCTSAAWSHDGNWMYFTANPGGGNHIWRQRFPDGQPEQITSGPTEEEGMAMAPDGRSFVTAVALQNTSLWVHDEKGERQISLEGNGYNPKFTPNGKKLCYLIVKEAPNEFAWYRNPGELRIADLESGRSEPVVRGLQVLDYDISADGQQVVMWTTDREGKPRLWVAPFDRSSPPVQIPNVEGGHPRFGSGGDIFFRHLEGMSTFVYRVHPDGTGLKKALSEPVFGLHAVSRDDQWIVAWAPLPGNGSPSWQAFPLNGGPPIPIGTFVILSWSLDGRSSFVSDISRDQTYIIPLAPGEALPRIPAGGFHSEEEMARLPGARRIDTPVAVPGPSANVYAFHRGTIQRNLYRIPIP